MPPILLALCSNISFATASLLYTEYARRISSSWMNYYKAVIAFLGFATVTLVLNLATPLPWQSMVLLSASGILGLLIGDIFMLKAFTHLGSGRVLMLFGFQPLLLGAASFYLFDQDFPWVRLVAVLLLIGCVLSFSLESFRQKGHWDLPGLGYAVLAVTLDGVGLLLTKASFEANQDLSPFYANVFRSGVTVLGFLMISLIPWFRLSLLAPLKTLTFKERWTVSGAAFLGTFMSLGFYLMAMKHGHLATISAVAGTSPLFASLFEIVTGRKKMTPYLGAGITFFIAGMLTLIFTNSLV
jgi:uncharacterized membrane protein